MTQEKACHYAKVLAQGLGKTSYVVRSRAGRFLPVQKPTDDCEILATMMPPSSARKNLQFALNKISGTA